MTDTSSTFILNLTQGFSNFIFNYARITSVDPFIPGPARVAILLSHQAAISAGLNQGLGAVTSPELQAALNQVHLVSSAATLFATSTLAAPALPAALVGAAAAIAVSTAFTILYDTDPDFKNAVDNFETPVIDAFEAAGEWSDRFFSDLINNVINLPSDVGEAIGVISDYTQEQFSDLVDELADLFPGAADALEGALDNFSDTLTAASEDLGDALNEIEDGFSDGLNSAMEAAAAAFNEALSIATPLVLDMDSDGLELSPLSGSNVFFDIDGDQFAERMGWVDADDGFLARDLNNNGNIDNVTELFGADGGTTAWQKLAALDTNTDNVINASDSGWSTLRIWKDANGNGLTDTDELKTLADHSITALSLQQNSNAFLATRV